CSGDTTRTANDATAGRSNISIASAAETGTIHEGESQPRPIATTARAMAGKTNTSWSSVPVTPTTVASPRGGASCPAAGTGARGPRRNAKTPAHSRAVLVTADIARAASESWTP